MPAKQLSHSEIWDDSALVDSWNEALDEYKKYHSIAAKNESVGVVLQAAEEAEASTATQTKTAGVDKDGGLPKWEPRLQESEDAQADLEAHSHYEHVDHSAGQQPTSISATMPQALLNTVQDENLKNLMMAWYYAGYYTGLHEGQQTASPAHRTVGQNTKKG